MNNQVAAENIANLNYRLGLLSSEMTLIMEQLRQALLVQEQDNGEISSDS